MAVSKKDVFLAKLSSIKNIIEKASDVQKKEHIAIHLGESFNSLISEISEEYPELKDSLPKPFTSTGVFHRMKKCEVNYLDLEIATEMVLSMLNLIEK
jgi:hypothetical protein